jgi:hypothetical protein
MQRADDLSGPTPRRVADFKSLYENGEFWSCCGLDGLSVVFDVRLESIRSLDDAQKRALMHLLAYLVSGKDSAVVSRVMELQRAPEDVRFQGLLALTSQLIE